MTRIYLDNNATTPIDPLVADSIASIHRESLGNPASQHWAGSLARRLLEDAREAIAEVLGAHVGSGIGDRVVLTSGGTEANNLVLRGLAGRTPGDLLVSAVEHPSVLETTASLEKEGHRVHILPVDASGVIELDALAGNLSQQTRLVSVMLANNETGVLQPIARIAELCRRAGVPFHTDAVQAVGKIPVSFTDLGVNAMSVAAHKFHGPVGIGALLLTGDLEIDPIMHGGFQQFGQRPGTEPVALAVGMARALTLWRDRGEERQTVLKQLRDEFEGLLRTESSLIVHAADAPRVPQTSCISFPGVDRQRLVIALDMAGIACSTGSACASGSSEPSHVLLAMGISDRCIQSAIRFSVGHQNTMAEIKAAAERIRLVYRDLRGRPETRKSDGTARKPPPKSI